MTNELFWSKTFWYKHWKFTCRNNIIYLKWYHCPRWPIFFESASDLVGLKFSSTLRTSTACIEIDIKILNRCKIQIITFMSHLVFPQTQEFRKIFCHRKRSTIKPQGSGLKRSEFCFTVCFVLIVVKYLESCFESLKIKTVWLKVWHYELKTAIEHVFRSAWWYFSIFFSIKIM